MITLILAALLSSPPVDTFPPVMEDDPNFSCALQGNHVCGPGEIPHAILWTNYQGGTFNV